MSAEARGAGIRGAILTYHSLDDDGSVLSTPPRSFAEQMRTLSALGVRVVGLAELLDARPEATAEPPRVAITFDDGFQSVYREGLPVLARHGFPATVFLVTDYCGKTNDWPGQPGYVQRRRLLDWHEIRQMRATGVAFGSHSRRHPDLRRLPAEEAEAELVASRQAIEDALGEPVHALAYPYGAYDATVKRLARAHFACACGTRLGTVGSSADRFALERIDMYYLRPLALFRRLLSPALGLYLRLRQLGRDALAWRG